MTMTSPSPSQGIVLDDKPTEDGVRPLSGPGTSRQTRRLQLRNAKFQGSSLPTRKVTPLSQSSSSQWGGLSGVLQSSDVENKSPGGTEAIGGMSSNREPSGALQEISNASLPRPRRSRHRVSLGKLFGEESSSPNTPSKYDSTSPEGQQTSMLPRAIRMRSKHGHSRQSVNPETRKYIEHLESELSTAQAQLSAATSPSITREQTHRMRNLNAETRSLQDEVADWEAKYDERVQEALNNYRESEARLRSRVRGLEQEAEETKARMQDLRSQLETTGQTLDATETANVNLEKRLEIMSGILAAAPNKIDLHVEIPGRARQGRPRSMFPRLPTAGAIIHSPDRQQSIHAASPSFSQAQLNSLALESPSQYPLSPVGFSSDAESVFSESSTGPSGIENPWGVPQTASGKAKPMRRMRKFGAGSFGPKPLILPSTSQADTHPTSAPPLDRNEGSSIFPFPPERRCRSPDVDLIRTTEVEHESIASRILGSPLLNITSPSTEEDAEDTLLCLQSPRSVSSTSRHDLSSLGPTSSRNLMDELTAARISDSCISAETSSQQPERSALIRSEYGGMAESVKSFEQSPHIEHYGGQSTIDEPLYPGSERPASNAVIVASHDWHLFHSHHREASIPSQRRLPPLPSSSAFDRLNLLFGDLWRNPVALARHFVRTAQTRMRLPSPLLNVQWWLVGVLLGPMARRRLLEESGISSSASHAPTNSGSSSNIGKSNSDESLDADILAYGTLYKTPPASPEAGSTSASSAPTSTRSASLVAGKGKKRALTPLSSAAAREPESLGFKHSPWLWLKFSLTLAFAVGVAFRDGPGSLMRPSLPPPPPRSGLTRSRSANWRRARREPLWVLSP